MAALAAPAAEAPAALEVVDLVKRYSETVTVGPLSFSCCSAWACCSPSPTWAS
jgi:hypothetical protein